MSSEPEPNRGGAIRRIAEARALGIKTLDLSGLELRELPPEIYQLTHLQQLDVSNNHLTVLPEELGQLIQLHKLALGFNQLKTLPEAIGRLRRLQILHVRHNHLTALPEALGHLTQLQELHIGDNQLKTLPEAMWRLAQLQKLYIWGNYLTVLPDALVNLRQLQEFYAGHNQLTALPETLGCLTQLRILQAWGNYLTVLPEALGQLTQLQELHVGENQLKTLPEAMWRLAPLQKLNVSNNHLTVLPEVLGKLTKLQELYAMCNQLVALPEALGQLTQLQALNLSKNHLTILPGALDQLAQLQHLDVSGNQLRKLPKGLDQLANRSLKALHLHDNEELGIPPQVLGPSFEVVYGSENQRLPPGKQVKLKPPKEMADYLRDHALGRLRPSNEAKLLVVGPGGHGKSSLIEYLVKHTFHNGKQPTEGIVITPWQMAGHELNGVRLNIWDFGGQEIQHSTHEFFLTDRSIYVLVCCARDDEAAKQGLYYWLDLIHLIAPDAPVIVALSKQDEIEYLINDAADLKKLHPKLVDFVPISCDPKPGKPDNRQRLIELIEETVRRELPHIRYRLPAAWVQVKEGLEQKAQDYLSYADFAQRCQAAGIQSDEDQRELASFLHALGTMLNYSDRLPLEQTHILNPRWVTEGVYAVALAPEVRASGGVLDEPLLNRLLSAECHGGRYPAPAQQFIRQMMLTFKLCYPLGARNGVMEYLVPNALPEDEPKDLPDLPNPLRFEIRFPRILPTSMMSRFIVAMHDQATTTHRWRLGLAGTLQGHAFQVTAHPKERVLRIVVGGTGRTRVSALDQIRQEFAVIFREKKGLEVQEFTFPPGHPDGEGYPFQNLLEAERSGQTEIWLPKVDKVNVREWLDGVTDPVARQRYQEAVKLGKFKGAEAAGIYIERLENLEAIMGDDRRVQVAGGVSGSVRIATGDHVDQGDQTQILTGPTADLRKQLTELRQLVAQLRGAGASADDCEVAEEAVGKIEGALQAPADSKARKEAKGALAMLKGVAEGMGKVAEIGTKFGTILTQVAPAMQKVFEWTS